MPSVFGRSLMASPSGLRSSARCRSSSKPEKHSTINGPRNRPTRRKYQQMSGGKANRDANIRKTSESNHRPIRTVEDGPDTVLAMMNLPHEVAATELGPVVTSCRAGEAADGPASPRGSLPTSSRRQPSPIQPSPIARRRCATSSVHLTISGRRPRKRRFKLGGAPVAIYRCSVGDSGGVASKLDCKPGRS
jgi:hypothetical protein